MIWIFIPVKSPDSKTTIMTCTKNSANSESDSEELKIFNSSINFCSNNSAPYRLILTIKTGKLVKLKSSCNTFK
jgi:hypothetical protein